MRLSVSIKARMQSFTRKHFELSKYGRKLRKLKDTHKGERCFIIGNGPSLVASDLDMLIDEYCFAFNRIYLIFQDTEWRPSFYCTQDEKIIATYSEEISTFLKDSTVFAPIDIKWYAKTKMNVEYFFLPNRPVKEWIQPEFSINIPHCVGVGNTVTYTAIELAVYMGFTDIYLLGIDHNFSVTESPTGDIVIHEGVKNYFTDQYDEENDKLNIPTLEYSTLAYQAARQYAKKNNINILNATRGGKLEIFPRIKFDELFDNCND